METDGQTERDRLAKKIRRCSNLEPANYSLEVTYEIKTSRDIPKVAERNTQRTISW